MKINLLLIVLFIALKGFAQSYSTSQIFAHNDYATARPFHTAYQNQVGYIEADIFLTAGELRVAHTEAELMNAALLEDLYLKPIQKLLIENNGYAYKGSDQVLTLMIDLKTGANTTLPVLIKLIESYPQLIQSKTFRVAISGNMPAVSEWSSYPS
ncbi:MAG TPA: alkaline phosphatase, partial [Cytophagales bacterium]|nr:alkaline phosphatase [Cytophagales bacterium]